MGKNIDKDRAKGLLDKAKKRKEQPLKKKVKLEEKEAEKMVKKK